MNKANCLLAATYIEGNSSYHQKSIGRKEYEVNDTKAQKTVHQQEA